MEKLREIAKRRREAHSELVKLGSQGYKAYLAMADEVFVDGALPKKAKELIAAGISVVNSCESCMQWHIAQAVNDGASLQEIVETIDVAIDMGGGPATVSARFALSVLKELFPEDFRTM